MNQCCATCKWSAWPLSKNGRRLSGHVGRCAFPLPVVVLPDSVTHYYGYSPWYVGVVTCDDGKNCPCYQKNEGKTRDIREPA